MTTAARPTFEPAKGGRGKGEGDLSALSKQYSSKDMPSHTKLKYRQSGQNTSEDLKARDFRRELEDKEHQSRTKRDRDKARSFTEAPAISSGGTSKKARLEQPPAASVDADDPVDEDEDDEDEDSDEDDTAELLKELQKIRKERMEEQEKKDHERREEEERIRTENLLKGNPLLNQNKSGSNFSVKRRWDDDVVFKNCAKIDPKNKSAPS